MAYPKTAIKRSTDAEGITAKKGKINSATKTSIHKKNLLNEAQAVYQPLYADSFKLLASSKKGLEAEAALDFMHLSGFTQLQFQETFKTSIKTIQNYNRQDTRLDAALSEKLLKSFSLYEKGIEVFGSANDFTGWLHQPAFGLGNQIPFEMMDTITGINLVEEELVRIAYGDLA